MYDVASTSDEKILKDLLAKEKYAILNSYDIHVALFVKYGKRDKEGNLKTPALVKNGIPVPAQVKLVSNFNRITDDTDVKIILNAELWEELSQQEKISTLDNMLSYLQIKEDKTGEPLTISESCDKVQLKLKHPDFYCEGFLDVLNVYGKNYIPWQEAKAIADRYEDKEIESKDRNPKEKVFKKDEEISNFDKELKIEKKEENNNVIDDETLDLVDSVLK